MNKSDINHQFWRMYSFYCWFKIDTRKKVDHLVPLSLYIILKVVLCESAIPSNFSTGFTIQKKSLSIKFQTHLRLILKVLKDSGGNMFQYIFFQMFRHTDYNTILVL